MAFSLQRIRDVVTNQQHSSDVFLSFQFSCRQLKHFFVFLFNGVAVLVFPTWIPKCYCGTYFWGGSKAISDWWLVKLCTLLCTTAITCQVRDSLWSYALSYCLGVGGWDGVWWRVACLDMLLMGCERQPSGAGTLTIQLTWSCLCFRCGCGVGRCGRERYHPSDNSSVNFLKTNIPVCNSTDSIRDASRELWRNSSSVSFTSAAWIDSPL